MNDIKIVTLFYMYFSHQLLQILLQPVMESIAIRDRVAKLIELGYETNISQCFTEIVSPRNVLITASK